MINKNTITAVSSILIVLIFLGLGFYYDSYHKMVRSSPKAYAYDTFMGPVNPVFIIEDLKYAQELVSFYESIQKKPDSIPSFNFPLKTLPQNDPIYVVGYAEDSSLVEIVSYYDRGKYFGGSYLRGWVYRKTLHVEAPYKELN